MDSRRRNPPMEIAGLSFSEEELLVDEHLGHPPAYAKLCADASLGFGPYGKGPPSAFCPYALRTKELIKAKDLNQLFPIIDPEAKPSENPNTFLDHLWKQLSHLGNAGFDPALFRVDLYGNVLYLYADHASPLSWGIDHWFPCSRGGRTVANNLRILQCQVCRRKHNRLEFLIPWWDLQLGVSVNQFLSIFASKNLDLKKRAFFFLFADGGEEELNERQTVESHRFPPQFVEKNRQVGLAPAAIVYSQNKKYPSIRKGKNHDLEMLQRSRSCDNDSKENQNPNIDTTNTTHLSISLARDSLRQREDAKKMHAEMGSLEEEMEALMGESNCERLIIHELEMKLIKKRRRVEKIRRLAETQNSYRELLEKMIRDAMHQDVIYKEQLRLNQAATAALMARLEAKRAMCYESEKVLYKKHRKKDEIEEQIRSLSETARKRCRMDKDSPLEEDKQDEAAPETFNYPLMSSADTKPSRKELREFLEEEHKAYLEGLFMTDAKGGEAMEEEEKAVESKSTPAPCRAKDPLVEDDAKKHKRVMFEEGSSRMMHSDSIGPAINCDDSMLDEEVGKKNVDKWLRALLENATEEEEKLSCSSPSPNDEPTKRIDSGNHQDGWRNSLEEEIKYPRSRDLNDKQTKGKCSAENRREYMTPRIDASERTKSNWAQKSDAQTANKHHGLVRSASAGNLRVIPPSPSLIPAVSSKLFKKRNVGR